MSIEQLTTLEEVHSVAALFQPFPRPWFISGGWAIDLFRGEATRPHEDLEVGVFREHQQEVRELLTDWCLTKVADTSDGPAWVPWYEGEWLILPIFQVKANRERARPAEFKLFLNDGEDNGWWFRRDPSITRSRHDLTLRTADGIPYLAPEVQLLYKARLGREKDEHDFAGALPLMNDGQRAWLREKLAVFLPGHRWVEEL